MKSAIIAFVTGSMLFMGGAQAEAASATWVHTYPSQNCVQAYWTYASYDWSGNGVGGYWAIYDPNYNPNTAQYNYNNPGPTLVAPPAGWTLSYDPNFRTGSGDSTVFGSEVACTAVTYPVDATFMANAPDVVAPGAPVSVSLVACSGDCSGSGNRGVWQGGYTPLNVVSKFLGGLFGGGYTPPLVGVSGSFNGGWKECDQHGSISCTGAYTAPLLPGAYSITLNGCINGGSPSQCAGSSIPITVACSSGTTWNGTTCAPPASCTYSGTLSWGTGCSANVNITTPSGQPTTITNTAPGYTGSEQYSCTNGTWAGPTNASCAVSSTTTWTNYCTGGNDVNGNNWQIWSYSNQTPTGYKYVGPGTAANGCAAPVSPGSCTFSGPLSWGAGCSANVNAAAPNNGAVTVTNTVPGYTGSVQFTCSSGAWVGPQNSSCSPFTPVNIVQSPSSTQTPAQTSSQPGSTQPPAQVCKPNAGSSCPSSPNFCGQTTTGTYSCTGVCSASTPSDSLCPPPTVSISASSLRVQSGKSSTISWSSTYAKSCTVTRNGAAWQSGLNSAGTLDPKIATQSVYELSCTGPGGTSSAQTIVNVVPTYQEF